MPKRKEQKISRTPRRRGARRPFARAVEGGAPVIICRNSSKSMVPEPSLSMSAIIFLISSFLGSKPSALCTRVAGAQMLGWLGHGPHIWAVFAAQTTAPAVPPAGGAAAPSNEHAKDCLRWRRSLGSGAARHFDQLKEGAARGFERTAAPPRRAPRAPKAGALQASAGPASPHASAMTGGRRPAHRMATFSSFASMVPLPSVSKRSKASLHAQGVKFRARKSGTV